jgi:hypothetical protein
MLSWRSTAGQYDGSAGSTMIVPYRPISRPKSSLIALMFSTGLGDGVYPVEARFEEAAGAVRIAELRVRFLPHPRLGYELP